MICVLQKLLMFPCGFEPQPSLA